MNPKYDDIQRIFSSAVDYVRKKSYTHEVEWQRECSLDDLTEQAFLRETAWVIINSGFKESIARRIFPKLELAFCNFKSSKSILKNRDLCLFIAKGVFGNEKKLKAILSAAELVNKTGFEELKIEIKAEPKETLMRIPFIGNVTALHLQKNIGIDVSKPDRHLVRLAEKTNFSSVDSMCGFLSSISREPVKVVDIILWRYMADNNWTSTGP